MDWLDMVVNSSETEDMYFLYTTKLDFEIQVSSSAIQAGTTIPWEF
jgi:hypothetical protein